MGDITTAQVTAAAVVIENIGTSAGSKVDLLASDRVVGTLRQEGGALEQLSVLLCISDSDGGFGFIPSVPKIEPVAVTQVVMSTLCF